MLLSHLFRRHSKRPLRALQVEVTSRCTRSCAVCPRTLLKDRWRDGDLGEDIWKALEPDLSLAEYIYLQGWGEPLLHPALPEWARAARQAGCKVGITTNGERLLEAMDWLGEGDVDLITLSVAGDEQVNRDLRDGSRLGDVLESAGEVAELARCRSLSMKVQLSYLLTRRNASAVSAVVEMAATFGLDAIFVIHLDCRPSRGLMELSAFNEAGLDEECAAYLDDAQKTAQRLGITYRGPALTGEEVLACALDPLRFAFLAWDGRVGPCVNLLLPIEGAIPRWSEAGETLVEPVWYGQLGESRLSELLESPSRQRFSAPFMRRLDAEHRFLSAMGLDVGFQALRKLDEADASRTAALDSSPLPASCAACPKGQGW